MSILRKGWFMYGEMIQLPISVENTNDLFRQLIDEFKREGVSKVVVGKDMIEVIGNPRHLFISSFNMFSMASRAEVSIVDVDGKRNICYYLDYRQSIILLLWIAIPSLIVLAFLPFKMWQMIAAGIMFIVATKVRIFGSNRRVRALFEKVIHNMNKTKDEQNERQDD